MKDNDGYDGSKLKVYEMWLLLEMEYERQMWAHFKKQYPDGFPWNNAIKTKDGEVLGKVIMVSTVDLDDSGASFIELWNDSPPDKESGLYRLFRPTWDTDEFGFKKEDDET